MTSKSLIVVVAIVSCICSPLRTTDAASLKKMNVTSGSIIDEILKDHEICASSSIFLNSRYVTFCNDVDYPKGTVVIQEETLRQLLCLSLYDRIYRLCWLATLSKPAKLLLPENSTMFDLQVEKLAKDKAADFCTDWKNGCPVKYQHLAPFLKDFNEDFKISTNCERFCTRLFGEFNSLCSVLAAMDAISIQTEEGRAECLHEEKVNENSNEGALAVVPPSTVHAEAQKPDKDSVKDTVSKQAASNLSSPEKNTANRIKDPTGHVPSTKVVQQAETHNTKSQDASSEPNVPSKPLEAAPAANLEKKNDKKDDESQIAGAIEEKKQKVTKGDGKSALSDLDLTNNGQINEGERPISEHESADQETEKVLDPPEVPNEEISEHTQDSHDEPTGGGVDTFDDSNELAPSTLVVPSEDVNESPPLPSDRQFIPRLPGIRNDDDSHFFGYFSVIGIICIAGYVGYHNKQKILAIVLEGRRSRGGRGRRRPSTANYRKLDCTLEEAVTSQCNSNVTHVIY